MSTAGTQATADADVNAPGWYVVIERTDVDAKNERYCVDDCYRTNTPPPDGIHIIPAENLSAA